ncbi:MAG: type IV secretory system conjugative DNA transfer family protein, partial [Bacteroidia bacterium]|nr:type IV secretory system conjugative DNA transfer family protein [Bacteroidia bacterium]
ALSKPDSTMHCIVYGVSGSGKSSTVFYNNFLVDNGSSFIARDVPKDFVRTAGFLARSGYAIKVINPTDALLSTDGVNVLAGEMSKGDIARVAQMIISASFTKKDYWVISAEEWCGVFLTILKQCCPEENHNLSGLKFLVESFIADVHALDHLVAIHGDDELIRAFSAIIAIPEKSRQSTLTTLKSSLSRIDENIALVTSISTFNWTDLRGKKTAVFIQSDVLDDEFLSLVQNLLYTDILRSLMKSLPEKDDLPISIFLDECSSLSIGKILETSFLNLRKYRVGLCCAFQSPQSIESTYSKSIAEVIQANAFAKLYLPGMDLDTAKYLQEYIGYEEVRKDNGSKVKEPIMSAFAIRTLKGKAVLLTGNNPASIIRLKPFYKIRRMRKRLTIPMPALESLIDKLPNGKNLTQINLNLRAQHQDNETK